MTKTKGSDVRLYDGGAACAHLRVEYRTEPVEEPKGAVRGFWQCTMCSTKFWPVAGIQLEEARVQAAAVDMRERCANVCFDRACKEKWGSDGELVLQSAGGAIRDIPIPTDALDAMLLRARNEERQTILNDMKRIGPNCNHPARCFSHIDPDPLKNVCDVCSMRIAMIEACAKYASEGLQDCHRGDYDPCSPHAVDCKTAVYEGIRALTQPAPEVNGAKD